MTISMYQASVPRFANILGNLSNIMDKTQAHIDARKIADASLTNYRLFPDMLPLTSQVQIACDAAKGVVARLAGIDAPVFEDNEKTIADLKARIAKTIGFIQSVSPAQIDGTEDKAIVTKRGDKETHYKGMQFHRAFPALAHPGHDVGLDAVRRQPFEIRPRPVVQRRKIAGILRCERVIRRIRCPVVQKGEYRVARAIEDDGKFNWIEIVSLLALFSFLMFILTRDT